MIEGNNMSAEKYTTLVYVYIQFCSSSITKFQKEIQGIILG